MMDSFCGDRGLACFAIIFNFWAGILLKAKVYPDWPTRQANSAWLTC